MIGFPGFVRVFGEGTGTHCLQTPLYTLISGCFALGICLDLRMFLWEETIWLKLGKSQQTMFFPSQWVRRQWPEEVFKLTSCSSKFSQISLVIHNQPIFPNCWVWNFYPFTIYLCGIITGIIIMTSPAYRFNFLSAVSILNAPDWIKYTVYIIC